MENAPWVLFPLFMLWSFPFWALVVVEFSFLFWCVSYRRGSFGLISLAVIALAFQFFGNIPVFNWMWEHWDWTLEIFFGWLALSAPWAVTKWWLFVRDNSYRYDEILEEYRKLNPKLGPTVADWSAEEKVAWEEYFNAHSYQDDTYEYNRVEFNPTASAHKSDIMTWMMFWPWSFLWTLLNDPLRKLFKNLYRMMLGWLNAITLWYWGDKLAHMPTAEQREAVNEARRKKAEEERKKADEERQQRWQEQQRASQR